MTQSDNKENGIEDLLYKVNRPQIWHKQPVYCFTSDIDWASEEVMKLYFEEIEVHDLTPTLFMTHPSEAINKALDAKKVNLGLHPNFLQDSSHGSSFKEVIETCVSFAPQARGFRSHRLFDVTDITHLLKNEYGMKYVSNLGTILQTSIYPVLHESGLVHFPIFFEDGSHLYNKLDLNIFNYSALLDSPGIKVISFHPMNFVFNSPSLSFMRKIKDGLTREEYQNLSAEQIKERANHDQPGIRDTILQIIDYVKTNQYAIKTMDELYDMVVE